MLIFKRMVVCSKCGFLGWRTPDEEGNDFLDRKTECVQTYRESFQKGVKKGDALDERNETCYIHCMRTQWYMGYGFVTADEIRKPRSCLYFIRYLPGYGPDEHKELKRSSEERATLVNTSLLSAAIGAVAAIAAQLLFVLLTGG